MIMPHCYLCMRKTLWYCQGGRRDQPLGWCMWPLADAKSRFSRFQRLPSWRKRRTLTILVLRSISDGDQSCIINNATSTPSAISLSFTSHFSPYRSAHSPPTYCRGIKLEQIRATEAGGCTRYKAWVVEVGWGVPLIQFIYIHGQNWLENWLGQ